MSLHFVRKYYGVPAYRGMTVSRMGRRGTEYGKITGSYGPAVNVRWKGHLMSNLNVKPDTLTYHPKEKR